MSRNKSDNYPHKIADDIQTDLKLLRNPSCGFGAKSTLSVKPRVKIQSLLKFRIKTALSGLESAVGFCLYSFC